MKKVSALLLVGSLLVSAVDVRAQFAEDVLRFSQFNLGVGARSLGIGNAGIGFADDYSALFRNPAGLALLRDNEFSLGLSQTGYKNDVSFLGNNSQSNLNSLSVNNLGLVYPIATVRGSLTFALGFGRVADYTTTASYDGFNPSSSIIEALTPFVNVRSLSSSERQRLLDENIPFQIFLADTANGVLFPVVYDSVQQRGTVEEGGGLNNWSLGGAIDIARNLSVGLSLNILSGSYRYEREYRELDLRNVYTYQNRYDAFHRFSYVSTVNSDISGFNALFGIMFRKPGLFKIGATVRTPTVYEITENFSDEGESEFDPTSGGQVDIFNKTIAGSTRYEVKTPPILSVGGSLQISDWLVLAGDAEYTDWTQMEFTTNNADLQAENRLIKRIFEPTTNLRGGAEVTLWNFGVILRGGVVWNPSPYKDDPPEYDQLHYTGGVGLRLDEHVSLNTAFAYGTWTTIRDNYYVQGLLNPSRTQEAVTSSNVNVTLSYRF
ncbi:MAG: OmpP1/FadL family transporter [Bacteroidota bacterium]